MKWFKHLTTANMDIALREIVEEFGCSGYGLWWITCELVGGQGVNFRLKKDKNWLLNLKIISKMSEEDIKKVLKKFSELGLINKKDLDSGILHIQNMTKYADEYTDKVVRKSRQCPDSVRVDKIRIDKNRLDKKITSKFIFKGMPCIQDNKSGKYLAYDNGEWLPVDERYLKDIKENK